MSWSNNQRCITNIKLIVEKIGIQASKWPGRCHEIAILIHRAGLVPKGSKVVYGLWRGDIAPGTIFSGRPFTRHGWIELPDGCVYDPTRFVFEGEDVPYIWVGEKTSEYDAGGNNWRQEGRGNRPSPSGRAFMLNATQAKVFKQFMPVGKDRKVYLSDCFWLANTSLNDLGAKSFDVYKTLKELGLVALIPVDNKREILG